MFVKSSDERTQGVRGNVSVNKPTGAQKGMLLFCVARAGATISLRIPPQTETDAAGDVPNTIRTEKQ